MYNKVDKYNIKLLDLDNILMCSYSLSYATFDESKRVTSVYKKLASIVDENNFIFVYLSAGAFYRYKADIGTLEHVMPPNGDHNILHSMYNEYLPSSIDKHVYDDSKVAIIKFRTKEHLLIAKTVMGL